jgi:hypothetical protein
MRHALFALTSGRACLIPLGAKGLWLNGVIVNQQESTAFPSSCDVEFIRRQKLVRIQSQFSSEFDTDEFLLGDYAADLLEGFWDSNKSLVFIWVHSFK